MLHLLTEGEEYDMTPVLKPFIESQTMKKIKSFSFLWAVIYLAGVIVLYSCLIIFFVGFSLHSRLPEIWLQRDPGLKSFIVFKKRIKIMSFPWAVISSARVIVLCSFS